MYKGVYWLTGRPAVPDEGGAEEAVTFGICAFPYQNL